MSLKFLIDENIPREIEDLLVNMGYEVYSIRRNNPGLNDLEIISLSLREHWIIVTFDLDFGHYIKVENLKPYGLILLRMILLSSDQIRKDFKILFEYIKLNKIRLENKFLIYYQKNGIIKIKNL